MSSKLAAELLDIVNRNTRSDCHIAPGCTPEFDVLLDEVRTVLESFTVQTTGCWCYLPVSHSPRCNDATKLLERLRKE